jgi:hypothetical protein
MIGYMITKNKAFSCSFLLKEGKKYQHSFPFYRNIADLPRSFRFDKSAELVQIEASGITNTNTNTNKPACFAANEILVIKFISHEEYLDLINVRIDYDEKGRVIYYETATSWFKTTYNEKGYLDSLVTDIGYKETYVYDEMGNEIYLEGSNGYKEWNRYDKDGNLIYSENTEPKDAIEKSWRKFVENFQKM